MATLLAINGSYREEGTIDQALAVVAQAAEGAGATVEIVRLRDLQIGFCRNCRDCTQAPGEAPGRCVQDDAMRALIDKIEAADAYLLASPTNFYSVTALFKRFMERLLVYAYWPWGAHAPKLRRPRPAKRALLIASAAAPALLARLYFTTLKQLRLTARTLGAKPVGKVCIGLAAGAPQARLDARQRRRLQHLTRKLLA